jgi:hypothetical protein
MKKLFIAIVLFSILFVSCKKGNDTNYHVTFTADGVNKSFTGHTFGHFETVGGFTTLSIVGATSSTSFDNYMGIYLDNSTGQGTIVAGQYDDTFTNFSLLSTYSINAVDHEAGQSVAADAVTYGVTIPNHFRVIITSMDDETIRGTFSGDFYKDGNVQTGTKISVTNGDFYVKLQ